MGWRRNSSRISLVVVVEVAHPDEVGEGRGLEAGAAVAAIEDAQVGGGRPEVHGVRTPRAARVGAGEHLVAHEGGVVTVELERVPPRAVAERAVVAVVKKQPVRTARRAVRADRGDQRRIGPLVYEHDVGARERALEVGLAGAVATRAQRGEARGEGDDGRLALVGEEAPAAPALFGLVDVDGVSRRLQLADDAAQEVSGVVAPVGRERVAEDDGLHWLTSTGASCAAAAAVSPTAVA